MPVAYESLLREFFLASIFVFLLFSWYRKRDSLVSIVNLIMTLTS